MVFMDIRELIDNDCSNFNVQLFLAYTINTINVLRDIQ